MIPSLIALAVISGSPSAPSPLALAAVAPLQKMTLEVSVKDGDTISGMQAFSVKVSSKSPVTQVEFYVNSELRDTDTSVPYEFKFDTLAEDDGDVKVKFAAYSSVGENASKTLTLHIDNGVSKGAAFQVQRGRDALAVSKWDEAIIAGRIALKADPKSMDARVVLARAYMGKGVWDKAQKYAEDAVAADPKSTTNVELLSAVNLNKAFNTVGHSGTRMESISTVADALKAAVTARRKILDDAFDNFGAVTDANRFAWADLALRSGRYSPVIETFTPLFRKDMKNSEVADRLLYALLKAGRLQDALQTLGQIKRYGAIDAYGNALEAVLQLELGDLQKSDEAMREAILSDPDNLGVKSAQAYIALKRNKTTVLSQLISDLVRTDSQRTEINYYLAALANRLSDPRGWTYFKRAALTEPTNAEVYVEWANYSLGLAATRRVTGEDLQAQIAYARALYETALVANPSSASALTGIAISALGKGDVAEALKYAAAASAAAPQYAAARLTYASALSAANQSDKASREMAAAGKLDPNYLSGRTIPKSSEVWQYFATAGRTVVMVPPGQG